MGSHHEEPPVQIPDVPGEEGVSDDAARDLDEESSEKTNYTERHPEHFRNPPEHVRDLREGIDADERGG
jgi:hypothetical protein